VCTDTVCSIGRLSCPWNSIEFFCVTQYKSHLLSLLKNLSHNTYESTKKSQYFFPIQETWKACYEFCRTHSKVPTIRILRKTLTLGGGVMLYLCLHSVLVISLTHVGHRLVPHLRFHNNFRKFS